MMLNISNQVNHHITSGKIKNAHFDLLNFEKDSLPLFIIPGSGGKTDWYRKLGKTLRTVCTVYGLEMVGTQKGEMPLTSIQEIAKQNIDWIQESYPRGPYRFLAHSFGAYVVYEMIRQLEEINQEVDFVFILDQPMGRREGVSTSIDKREIVIGIMKLARDYFESFKIVKRPYPDWIHELSDQLQNIEIKDMVHHIAEFTAKRIPHKAKRIEYFSRLVNIRVYNRLMAYFPTGKVKSEVLVLVSAENNWTDCDKTLGWSTYSCNVKSFVVPGNHWNMVWTKNVAAIAKHIKKRIRAK